MTLTAKKSEIGIANAPGWRRGAPEHDACGKTSPNKVGIVNGDEVARRQMNKYRAQDMCYGTGRLDKHAQTQSYERQ